ncbi:protein ImuB [Stella humosa]|uniref:Protein ImuB n=1 Tax=Stella humosa TaxID=94 RepID=A0A3N1M0L0_9PROT|nr:protein ImuB [Stella humosa]BBK31393.1 DNA-directed DNA polymerase [Stella humosa]
MQTVGSALRLVAVDRAALGLGLAPGLTLADARARIPDLAVADADPAADARLLDRLAALCSRWTPLVALDGGDGLLLDITGCAHLFGGEAALRVAVCGRLAGLGLALRASIAGTPEAARAQAQFGRATIVPPGRDEGAGRRLPIAALRLEADAAVALSRAGLKLLGDLADRPAAALAARFGAGLVRRIDRVLGREDGRITPVRPPPACMVERHFPEPLMQADGIAGVLEILLVEVARLLEERGAGGRVFEASFFRTDGAVRRLVVETGRPSRDRAAVLRLFHERLDGLADPLDPGFGFDVIRLGVPVAEPLAPAAPDLDGRAVEREAVADLVDRLATRLGRDRVLRFVARDTHHPDREAGLVPAVGGPPPGLAVAWRPAEPDEPPTRPLQLFDPPQPIETMAEVPDGPPVRFRWRRVLHQVARAEGPERIAPEWWRDGMDAPTRDYYRVEDAEGRRFWVFREGLYAGTGERPRWFLHGLFA